MNKLAKSAIDRAFEEARSAHPKSAARDRAINRLINTVASSLEPSQAKAVLSSLLRKLEGGK